ncbi:MAG: zinc-dependent alcohol dehydrogenase family protein [Anaerolineales bacterium]
MRRLRLHAPGDVDKRPLTIEECPIPQPSAMQVRIKVSTCGVCHTDLHIVEGDIHPPQLPITPGHQIVGVIDALGQQADSKKIGQRVGLPWLHSACGVCNFCKAGNENLCERALFTGFHIDGGFAEYLLAEAAFVLPIPASLSDVEAAPLLCAGIVGYRSLRLADLQPGERLGLFGFGASGHLSLQIARHWGCEVYAFTRAEAHRRHALQLGAVWAGAAQEKPPKLLDRAVIFAPAGNLVPLALEKLRPGGTLALNAIHMTDIPAMPYQLVYGERTLRSVANATRQDGMEFLRLAAEIPIQVTTTNYPLEQANEALADMKHSRINGEAVLTIETNN